MKYHFLFQWVKSSVLLSVFFCIAGHASTSTLLINKNNYTIGRRDIEVNFGINTSIFRGDVKGENFSFDLGGNYFLTDIFAPGLDFQIDHVNGAGTSARFVPNLKAYWPTYSRLLPYAQVGLGFAHVPGDDGFAFGLGVGANYLLSTSVAIGIKFSYELIAGSGTIHQIALPIGFAIYFGI